MRGKKFVVFLTNTSALRVSTADHI